MPGKTPDKEPVENGGYRGGKDLKPKGKKEGKKASKKEGDDEMTVVVPPSKASKQSSVPPPNDAEGDVAMDDADKAAEGEAKVDPVAQTINGMPDSIFCSRPPRLTRGHANRYQEQFRPSRSCRRALRRQILSARPALHLVNPETPDPRYPCPGYFRDLPVILS
jgi:26S proteasome regulatory subunit N3